MSKHNNQSCLIVKCCQRRLPNQYCTAFELSLKWRHTHALMTHVRRSLWQQVREFHFCSAYFNRSIKPKSCIPSRMDKVSLKWTQLFPIHFRWKPTASFGWKILDDSMLKDDVKSCEFFFPRKWRFFAYLPGWSPDLFDKKLSSKTESERVKIRRKFWILAWRLELRVLLFALEGKLMLPEGKLVSLNCHEMAQPIVKTGTVSSCWGTQIVIRRNKWIVIKSSTQ